MICRYMPAAERRKIWESEHGLVPEGQRVGWSCEVPYCGNSIHMVLAENKNAKKHNWREYGSRLRALPPEEYFDITEFPGDEKSKLRLRTALNVYGVRFVMRSLPKGVRIIRVTESPESKVWNRIDPDVSVSKYPYLISRSSELLRMNGMKPGGFFLGLLWGTSLHLSAIPKYQHCAARGCVFPANGNGDGLCRHHFHFFDYRVSRLGRHLDMADLYGDDDEAPRFYVNWFWKHERESLKFEHKGSTSWWQERVNDVGKWVGARVVAEESRACSPKKPYATKEEAESSIARRQLKPRQFALRIHAYLCPNCSKWHVGNDWSVASMMADAPARMAASPSGLHRGTSGLHRGKHPRNRIGHAKASQKARRQGMVANRVGNKRCASKPEKRWSRERLEIQADRILAASGFFEEFSAASAATCARKKRYEDKQTAKAALRNINRENRGGKTLEAYHCRDCQGWHLGNRWSPTAFVRSDPVGYLVHEPELSEAEERDLLAQNLHDQQAEFERIFNA